MPEMKFDVYGQIIAISRKDDRWLAFILGADGKRRPADFIVPGSLAEEQLCQYLADLWHETASPAFGKVIRIS